MINFEPILEQIMKIIEKQYNFVSLQKKINKRDNNQFYIIN